MGRYISMGPAFSYSINKESLHYYLYRNFLGDLDEKTIQEELLKHFNMGIYCFEEDDEWYMISLRKDIPVKDILELFDEFQKVDYERRKEELDNRKKVREDISILTNIDEIAKYSKGNHIGFWDYVLSSYWMEMKFSNKKVSIPVRVDGIAFYLAYNKTLSECEFESYDLFTNYLRFRLQHTKLADSMLIFLTE